MVNFTVATQMLEAQQTWPLRWLLGDSSCGARLNPWAVRVGGAAIDTGH